MQAASCVDASSGFSGNLTFMHSTFADNGPAVGSLSTVNAPPVAVNCAGGSGPVSCSITVQDTLFESNRGREALGMGLTCLAPSTQTCNFDVTRSNFTQHQLVGTGSSYAMPYSITTVAAMYTSVGTTAAALVVKVDGASAFSLAVSLCHFAANDGAGLWVEQSRPDSHPTSVRGEVSITGSSFTGHAELPGGLPALAVFGARGVSLTDTLWEGNRMGAVALECIQDEVFVDAVVVRDNLAHSSTAATFDIYMMDAAPSNVTVTGSSFVNNTGFTSLPPGALYYSGAGSINVASHVSQGAVNISIAATSFLSNHGSLSPGALSIITADGVIMTGVLAAGNVGGAAFFYNVTTLLVSNSTFDANEGLTGPGSNYIAKSPGGGAVTSVSPIGVAGQSSQVSNCHFNNNSALTSGAALYFTGLSVINVQDCVFTSNRALTGFGGAINTNLMAAPSMVTLSNSRFHDNVAAIAGGGALSLSNMKTANGEVCEITNTTFTGNSAYPTPQLKCPGAFCIPNDDVRVPGDGGAISASGGVLLLSGGCKFDSNSAQGREESGDAALMDAFFASVALDMDAYSDAQCAEGYKGRLCGVCADGYGSTDIATCVKCPTFALNTLYYLLATLLTLALLALAMHTSIKEAAKMQMEHDERIQAAQELEEQDEELDQQGGSVINTMRNSGGKANQRPSERSSPVSAVGHLKMDTPTTNTMTSTGEPHAHHSQASLEGLQPRQGDQEPAALHPLSTTHTDESQPAVRGGEVQMPGAGAPFNTLVAVDNGVSPSERHGVVDSGSVVSQIKANKMLHGDATAAVDGERPVRSHFHDPRSPFLEDAQQAQAVVIRILLSYLQVLGLLQNVPHIYPSKVQRFLVISSQSTSPGAAVSLDCSLPAYETASKATIQTIVFALAPVYIVMACWIGWTLRAAALYHLARLSGKGRNGIDPTLPMLRGTSMYLARVLTMTCVVVVFFFYPASVQSLLEIFDCDVVDVGAPSNPLMARAGLSYGSYWRQEYSQQCYVGAHEALAMGLGVPGLALLALGWPFMCGLWLYMNTQKLYQDPHFTGM
ncbi:MAG: hypothetical protein WDW36_009051 [Sanguina aurantia]